MPVFKFKFSESTIKCIFSVKALQFATIDGDKLTNPDAPGSTPYIAMEINNSLYIVTDLETWQPYKRFSPGPLADGTGGVLQTTNAVSFSRSDLQKIKESLAEWKPCADASPSSLSPS